MYNPREHLENKTHPLQGVPPNYNGRGAPSAFDFSEAIQRMRAEDAAADARIAAARNQIYANDPMSQPGSPRLPYPPEDIPMGAPIYPMEPMDVDEGAGAPRYAPDRAINPEEDDSPDARERFLRNIQLQAEADANYVPPSQLLAQNGGPLTTEEIRQYLPNAIEDIRDEERYQQARRRLGGQAGRRRDPLVSEAQLLGAAQGEAVMAVSDRLGRVLQPEEADLVAGLVEQDQAEDVRRIAEQAMARQRAYTQRLTQQTNFG